MSGTDATARVLSAEAAIELAHAMVAHHLGVAFAPIVCLAHGLDCGADAQPRWSTLDAVDPATRDLLHLARSTGPTGASSEALLDEAARAAHRAAGPTRVHVHLSASDLRDPKLVSKVARVLERHRVAASSFCMELAEADVLVDPDAAGAVLRDLHTLGCGVVIGDVGAGCVALTQRYRMPIDQVRIHASHVTAMLDDTASFSVVSAIVHVAREHGITTIASGVQRAAQADWLRDLGCDLAQGDHLGAPADRLVLPLPHTCSA